MAEERLDLEIRARDRARQIIEEVRREMREANSESREDVQRLATESSTAIQRVRESAQGGARGVSNLSDEFDDLAQNLGRVPGPLGDTARLLGDLVAGGIIIGGIGLIAAAIGEVAENARESREELQALLDLQLGSVATGRQAQAGQIGTALLGLRGDRREALARQAAAPEGSRRAFIAGLEIQRIDSEIAQLEASLATLNDIIRRENEERNRLLIEQTQQERQRAQQRLLDQAERDAIARARRTLRGANPNFGQLVGNPEGRTGSFPRGDGDPFAEVRGGLILEPIEQVDTALTNVAESMGETELFIRQNGRALVGAIGGAAISIAQFAQGNTLGGLGGLFSALAFVPGIGQVAGFGLGVAGIGFSLLDALTDDRTRDSRRQAHLDALREFENERPPANIILRLDAGDREFQTLLDDARREALDAGFNPRIS